jgi:hypothetical protein
VTNRNLEIPRPFNFQQLGGEITEEVAIEYEEWAPAIQLLEFEDGRKMLRFCYYVKSGQLAPRALSLDETDVYNLRKEIQKNPHVKHFLQQLLSS